MRSAWIPKIIGILLCVPVWMIWPPLMAAIGRATILLCVFLMLLIPIFNPRSSYFIKTFSSVLPERRQIALTFDDGPDPRFTPEVLAVLKREGIRAAFFLVGDRAAKHPNLVADIVRQGHIIGNHSHTHALNYHFQSKSELRKDLDDFDTVILGILGLRCLFYRAPQGIRTPGLAAVLSEKSLFCIGWTTRGLDSIRKNPETIFKALKKNLRAGGIVMLHDGGGLGGREDRSATLVVLPRLIHEAKIKGLTFERLDTMLGLEPYSQ